jgi:repressor LexA
MPAGIVAGALVCVRRQQTAVDGEVVVAQLEDEATVKRLFRREGRVVLQPENDAYEPIVADDVMILGRVVGVLRKL